MTTKTSHRTAPLTQAHQTLKSSRDAGFDLSAASGEVIDNAIEAQANVIRIATLNGADKASIEEVAFADNGSGVPVSILADVLSLGYSSRYGSRAGLGRFGMGLKLASLSQARRVEVYTKTRKDPVVYRTLLDLDLVESGEQKELSVEEVSGFPEEFANLMKSPKGGQSFDSGTMVVWRKIDRLTDGGRYGDSVRERMQELTKFLGRAYRLFLDKGLYIELDERPISLHDPLFLLENPRVAKHVGHDVRAEVVDATELEVDGHKVQVTVALLPQELRPKRGGGGIKELYYPDEGGSISILRQGREIYFALVPKMFPGGTERSKKDVEDKVDRYIGVEVRFPAALDEYFQVRNVKRGAEPVSKLREELRKFLQKPIKDARKKIRDHWNAVQTQEAASSGDSHKVPHDVVSEADQTSPKGQAKQGATPADVDQTVKEIMEDLGVDASTPEGRDVESKVRTGYDQRPITIIDGAWPGKELIDIAHLNGKAIVKINRRHPFISEIYEPIRAIAQKDLAEVSPDEISLLFQRTALALDVLFMAYAKAENMHPDPDTTYGELRTYWGVFSGAYVKAALGRAE